MSNDNVISLGSRKPLAQALEEVRVINEESKQKSIEASLAWFDQIRGQIASGALEMPVVIAYSRPTGLFFNDWIAPDAGVPYGLALSYLAQLELVKLQMANIAELAPILQVDGTILEQFEDEE